ncbi:lysophosphatidylserine lipase ABHD12 isoform X2 [Astyanax mexicanus]|uniref:lysophosphatidylserine lipase ABHD12 isoform X2 n=1 Tax=Astyanax mexicanus TaxID=7994 RepID=UPI0020CABAD3|nr:lysophosphatidylserine lipase ABHD12 isoform X2 [Astyanax mexicanus]
MMRRRVDGAAASDSTEGKSGKDKAVKVRARSSWRVWIKWTFLVLCVLYAAPRIIPRLFPAFVQHMVYSHAILWFVDLSRPADLALNHTINMYLSSEEGITLGVWHTVPEHKWKEAQGKDLEWYEKSLGDGSPVFIYLHANMHNRAAPHRIGVANLLSSLGYHAVVMDYRGFGDSTGEPTEKGLLTDSLYLYHWVKARSEHSLVIMWGHSIGTLVTTNTAMKLQEQGNPVDAVIIEGSFTDSIRKRPGHPFDWFYWRFPYIQYYILGPKESKRSASNEDNLKKMKTPLLMLHAEDDKGTPFTMAQELYSAARSAPNSKDRVKLVSFDGSLGYGHSGLYRDPALPGILREFVKSLTDH